jgi:hypothetical protein
VREVRRIERRQRLGRAADQLGQAGWAPGCACGLRLAMRLLAKRVVGQLVWLRGPARLADERHEHHAAEIFLRVLVLAGARDLHELLKLAHAAHRHHEPAADLQLRAP